LSFTSTQRTKPGLTNQGSFKRKKQLPPAPVTAEMLESEEPEPMTADKLENCKLSVQQIEPENTKIQ